MKDKLNPKDNLITQGYNRSNNMLEVKSRVGVRIKVECLIAVDNQYFYHSSHLTLQ